MILMKNNTLFTGILLLFFLTLTNAQAQLRHTEFLNIGVENGLSHSSVTCIAQDSIGFIWVGTKNGLNRFDGHDFKVYQRGDSINELRNSMIYWKEIFGRSTVCRCFRSERQRNL